jgi:opacity protein-like surface antigen
MRSNLTVSWGIATVDTKVTGTSGGSDFTDSATRTGFTASIGVQVPVAPQVAATAQFRWINVPNGTVNIPGAVQIDGNRYIGTVGLTWYPWAPTAPAR